MCCSVGDDADLLPALAKLVQRLQSVREETARLKITRPEIGFEPVRHIPVEAQFLCQLLIQPERAIVSVTVQFEQPLDELGFGDRRQLGAESLELKLDYPADTGIAIVKSAVQVEKDSANHPYAGLCPALRLGPAFAKASARLAVA